MLLIPRWNGEWESLDGALWLKENFLNLYGTRFLKFVQSRIQEDESGPSDNLVCAKFI